jgi:hypothetical protein
MLFSIDPTSWSRSCTDSSAGIFSPRRFAVGSGDQIRRCQILLTLPGSSDSGRPRAARRAFQVGPGTIATLT